MMRPAPVRTLLSCLAAALCAVPAGARAQGAVTGAVGVYADVLYPPLTGAGVHALDFGVLVPGAAPVTVAPRTNASGEFRIMGTKARKSLDITFTLPTSLSNGAGATIPLNFNGNFAGLCEVDQATGLCVAASYTAYNPVTSPTFHDTPQRYQPGRKTYTYDEYAIYIGGTATPSASQRPGHYTASISALIVIN